jgi:hypothetical protein
MTIIDQHYNVSFEAYDGEYAFGAAPIVAPRTHFAEELLERHGEAVSKRQKSSLRYEFPLLM